MALRRVDLPEPFSPMKKVMFVSKTRLRAIVKGLKIEGVDIVDRIVFRMEYHLIDVHGHILIRGGLLKIKH